MTNLQFTGERVVPDKMNHRPDILIEHIARYNFARKYCKNKKVLDAACGTGYGCEIIDAIKGIDKSSEAIEYAKERYTEIEFEVCELEKDFIDENYDVITSFETIEHLEDANTFLKNVSEHCVRLFIFSIPINMPSEFHKQVFTIESAKELINKYFNDVEWYGQSGFNITPLENNNPTYLIGIAKIYE